jgi:hypothetical protein
VVGPQLVELAPRVHQAAHLGYAQLEAGVVAREVVADELAVPAVLAGVGVQAQEAAYMLPATPLGEVEHDRLERVVGGGAVSPDVGPVRLLVARLEHRHRGLVGVQHPAAQHHRLERVDQRLQLHAALAHPSGQR